MAKKNHIPRVTDEQIAAMVNTEAISADPERSGSPDKDGAVAAENAPPKVKTFTVEGRLWMERDPYGLKTEALYGQHGRYAIRPNDQDNPGDLTRRAQFLGRPLTVANLEEIHRLDETAPDTMNCTTCGKAVTLFVKTAMINKDGDLFRDKEGNVTYRGQFVTTGRPLAVHAAHTGTCLYELRDNLKRRKELPNGRKVADILASQSFDQANARLAGIQGHFAVKASENQAMQQRLGATVGDAVRHSRHGDDGFDRGAATPKTPRGQSRRQPRRWVDEDVVAE